MPKRNARFYALIIVVISSVSCTTPKIQRQSEIGQSLAASDWTTETIRGESPSNWIESFDDVTLAQLVTEALENNFGLEAATQRTNAAAAVVRISGSLKYPNLGVDLRSSRQKSIQAFDPVNSYTSDNHSLNLSSQWELDLWQRIGKGHAASIAQFEATEYDFEALKLSLAGQIAKAWFNATEAKTQYDLAAESAKSYDTNLQTLEKRYNRGLTEAFDLRLTRAQAASTRANALNRRSQFDSSIRNLETLLGRYPSGAIEAAEALPTIAGGPPAALPSELLERRPDLLAGERRLAALFAQDQATQRNWLPSLRLTGSEGTLSNEFSDLVESNFNVWSLAGNLTLPLFQAGRLKAERDQSEANYLSQVAQYKDTVLRAFREVEVALRAEKDLKELEDAAQIAATENQLAEEQSWNLYERGLVSITSVLDSERRSLDARSQLISVRNRRLQNRIDLHIALGGGFAE